MDKHIKKWLDFRAEIQPKIDKLAALQKKAEKKAKPPAINQLRPATTKDIVEGNIFWHLPDDDNDPDEQPFWNYVSETANPSEKRDAYLAHDGSTYILSIAYIKK